MTLLVPPLTLVIDNTEHCYRIGSGSRDDIRLKEEIADWCDAHLKPGWVYRQQELLMEVAAMAGDPQRRSTDPRGVTFTVPTIRFADDADMLVFKMKWGSRVLDRSDA